MSKGKMEPEIVRFNIQELWDFTLKEICKNLECSKVDFVLDRKRYFDFKRRFDYFVRKRQGEENEKRTNRKNRTR